MSTQTGPVRGHLVADHAHTLERGDRRLFINDEGNLKGPRAPEDMQEAEDVIEVIDPSEHARHASRYVRRLRRRANAAAASRQVAQELS